MPCRSSACLAKTACTLRAHTTHMETNTHTYTHGAWTSTQWQSVAPKWPKPSQWQIMNVNKLWLGWCYFTLLELCEHWFLNIYQCCTFQRSHHSRMHCNVTDVKEYYFVLTHLKDGLLLHRGHCYCILSFLFAMSSQHMPCHHNIMLCHHNTAMSSSCWPPSGWYIQKWPEELRRYAPTKV